LRAHGQTIRSMNISDFPKSLGRRGIVVGVGQHPLHQVLAVQFWMELQAVERFVEVAQCLAGTALASSQDQEFVGQRQDHVVVALLGQEAVWKVAQDCVVASLGGQLHLEGPGLSHVGPGPDLTAHGMTHQVVPIAQPQGGHAGFHQVPRQVDQGLKEGRSVMGHRVIPGATDDHGVVASQDGAVARLLKQVVDHDLLGLEDSGAKQAAPLVIDHGRVVTGLQEEEGEVAAVQHRSIVTCVRKAGKSGSETGC